MGFFDSLFGRSSARAAQQTGQQNAAYINQGADRANDYSRQGFDQSMGFYRPFAESGARGQTAYENTLGLNGAPARQRQFQESYLDDPALAYRDGAVGNQINALLRKYNAGGQGVNSGGAAMGVGRLRQEAFDRDWGGIQNRLQGVGGMGFQAAQGQAGLTSGYYGGMADREMGRANALAQNNTNATMAANNARAAGINNLLSIGGLIGGTAARMLPMPGGPGGGSGWRNPDTGNPWNGRSY